MNMYIHKMKINFTYIFLAFILIFLIMVSISKSCVKISPYEGSYGNMYPYEAMTPMMNPMMTPMMNSMMSPSPAMTNSRTRTHHSPSPAMTNTLALHTKSSGGSDTIDSGTATNLLQSIMNQMSPSANTKSSEGFTSNSTVDVTSYNYSDNKLDVFSGTQGRLDCASISSNLTNSQGPLCLNNAQIGLLKTRGGNASGGDAQIGK